MNEPIFSMLTGKESGPICSGSISVSGMAALEANDADGCYVPDTNGFFSGTGAWRIGPAINGGFAEGGQQWVLGWGDTTVNQISIALIAPGAMGGVDVLAYHTFDNVLIPSATPTDFQAGSSGYFCISRGAAQWSGMPGFNIFITLGSCT